MYGNWEIKLGKLLSTLFLAAAIMIYGAIPHLSSGIALAESFQYLFDSTGNGWVCFWANEQMDADHEAGIYPDGTKVRVLERRDDGLFDISRYQVQIGRLTGWVFEDALQSEEEWQKRYDNGQYVLFNNLWHVNASEKPKVYGNANDFATVIRDVTESSFIVLGIFVDHVHAQLSDTDGFIYYDGCMGDGRNSADTQDLAFSMWMNTIGRAVRKAKGSDAAGWSETESAMLMQHGTEDILPTDRRITPGSCDIGLPNAVMMAKNALLTADIIREGHIDRLECELDYLFYDLEDSNAHFWFFSFVNKLKSDQETFERVAVILDAHTGQTISIVYP